MKSRLINTRPFMAPQDTYSLRGICMLMIIIHHVFKQYSNCPDSIMRWGYLGVAVFFVISGWGMYCSMERQEDLTWGYFAKQMKKLLIPYVIIWPIAEIFYCVQHIDYLSVRGLLRDFITLTFPPYPALWFFKVIVAAYVLSIGTFILIKSKITRLVIISLFSIIYYILAWKVVHLPMWWWGTSLCIVAGMWMAAYKEKLEFLFNNYKYILLIGFVIAYFITLHHNFLHILPSRTVHSFIFAIAMLSAVSVFNIVNPISNYIGRNSLLFYLFHIPICELLTPPHIRVSSLQMDSLSIRSDNYDYIDYIV